MSGDKNNDENSLIKKNKSIIEQKNIYLYVTVSFFVVSYKPNNKVNSKYIDLLEREVFF